MEEVILKILDVLNPEFIKGAGFMACVWFYVASWNACWIGNMKDHK